MGREHLLTDNPEAIAFGRGRLSALRAAGKRYVTQVYDTPFGRVTVRIVGGVEYISAETTGNLYLIFWAPGASVTPGQEAEVIARHNTPLSSSAWYDRKVYAYRPGRYFVVATSVPECKAFKLVRTFSDVAEGEEEAAHHTLSYEMASVVTNKLVYWRRESTGVSATQVSTTRIEATDGNYRIRTDSANSLNVEASTRIIWGGATVSEGRRTFESNSFSTQVSLFDSNGHWISDNPGGIPVGISAAEREDISGVWGRSLTAGWDIYAHPTTDGYRANVNNTFVDPAVHEASSNWVSGWKYGKVGNLEPPKGADQGALPAPDPVDALPPAQHAIYPPELREAIDGGYRRMYLDLRPHGGGQYDARIVQASKDYLYAVYSDGFVRARLGDLGGAPIPTPQYYDLFGETGVAKLGNFPTAERYYTAFFDDCVTMVRGSRASDPGQFSIVTTEFATGQSTVIEQRDLGDLLPPNAHLLGALREEIINQPKPKEP